MPKLNDNQEPYDWVMPKLNDNRKAVSTKESGGDRSWGAAADTNNADEEAAESLAAEIRLAFIGKMNSTFTEQEALIATMRKEIKDLTRELRAVKARRYDVCSQCSRELI